MVFITGIMTEDMNWLLAAVPRSASLSFSKARAASASPPKAWTMLWPPYISSICPLSDPR
jgi:hypothetical protein